MVIAEDLDVTVYLADSLVIVYDERRQRCETIADPQRDLRCLRPGTYAAAMDALGIDATIEP